MDRRRESDGWPPFCAPTTSPHFFKIILDDTSRYIKLRLPFKFVKRYGGELSNSASLKLPDGLEWHVDITRCDSKVWFEEGWPNFSDYYSINHGQFLVFGYQGNSEFDVCIFDKTATEIDYSITVKDKDVNSSGIMEDCLRGFGNSRDESPLPGSLPRKKNRKKSAGKPNINPNIQMDDDDDNENSDVGTGEDEDEDNHHRRMHPMISIRKEIALQKANAYKPADPHFVTVINPSSTKGGYLHVPSAFSNTYLAKQPAIIMLQSVSDKEPWSVYMHYGRSSTRLRAGWSGFVRSKNLSSGDACVFVLRDRNIFLFDVVFYLAT